MSRAKIELPTLGGGGEHVETGLIELQELLVLGCFRAAARLPTRDGGNSCDLRRIH